VVIDPEALFEEISMLERGGVKVRGRLFISVPAGADKSIPSWKDFSPLKGSFRSP
jgi:hypothetical protein